MSPDRKHHIPRRAVEIIELIAEEHNTTLGAIIGPRSSRNISQARQEVYYVLSQARTASGRQPSLSEIGRWLGGRDHTSVAHGIMRHLNPDDTRPKSIAVSRLVRERQPMANVVPVSPEVQARVLEQFYLMGGGRA